METFPPHTLCFSSIQNRTEDSEIWSGLGIDLWYNDQMEMTKPPCGCGDHNNEKSLDMLAIAMTWLVPRKSEPYPHSSPQDLETD